jgi:hypothetical protein
VFFFMLARRAPRAPAFGAVDLVPLAGLIAASILVVIWVRAEDVTLRPCRLGNEAACETIAGELIETAERSPIAAPIPWEDRAAGVLDQRACPGSEPAPCAVQLYAVGSVAVRAGRADAAKDAFMRACETDRGWCARAAQEKLVHWTDEERERLGRRAGG